MLEPIIGLCLLAAVVAAVLITRGVRRRRDQRLAAGGQPQLGPVLRSGSRPGQWMQVVARYGGPGGHQPGNQWLKPANGAVNGQTMGVTFTNLSAICPVYGDVMAECECPDCTELRRKMNRG